MIYYSHVNEDNEIERNLLSESKCSRCICVAGSGERFISLLDINTCKEFICVDINQSALYLTSLKLALLKRFSVLDYLKIIGYSTCSGEKRLAAFHSVSYCLDAATLAFWKHNEKWLKRGILHCGAFERFLSRIRPMLHFFLGKQFYSNALNSDVQKPQSGFRWSLIKKIFGLKIVYKLLGNSDAAFVGKRAKLYFIPKVIDHQLKNQTAIHSLIFHLIFRGDFSEMAFSHLPVSLKPEHLENIKNRLSEEDIQISYIHQDLLEFLKTLPANSSPAFISASDILSFVPVDYVEKLTDLRFVRKCSMVIRSFIRNRISSSTFSHFVQKGFKVRDCSSAERSGMYQVLSLTTHESI